MANITLDSNPLFIYPKGGLISGQSCYKAVGSNLLPIYTQGTGYVEIAYILRNSRFPVEGTIPEFITYEIKPIGTVELISVFKMKNGKYIHTALRTVNYDPFSATDYDIEWELYTYIKDSVVQPDGTEERYRTVTVESTYLTSDVLKWSVIELQSATEPVHDLFYVSLGVTRRNIYYPMCICQLDKNEVFVTENPEPEVHNGYYNGLWDGGTPYKEVPRRGVNYLNTIDVHDETYYPKNAIYCASQAHELTYNGVEFSYPNIIFKAHTDLQFTHCVTASWSANNRPVCYKVISEKCLGGDLHEYTVTVDGVKTWFMYHDLNDSTPFCHRSTNVLNYSKWAKDSLPYDGTYNHIFTNGNTLGRYYGIVINGKTYIMSQDEYTWLCGLLTTQSTAQKALARISCCYMIAINGNSDLDTGYSPCSENPFSGIDGFSTWAPSYECVTGFMTVYCRVEKNVYITDQRHIYDSKCTVHIPSVGDVDPPATFIKSLSEYDQSIRLRISGLDGTVSVAFAPFMRYSSPVVLPSIDLPYDPSNVSLYTVNRTREANNANAGVSTIAGMVGGMGSGAIMGGAFGAVAGGLIGAIGGIASMAQNEINYSKETDIINETQGLTSMSCTGAVSFADMLVRCNLDVPHMQIDIDDYYKVVGYPVKKYATDMWIANGDTLWLTWNVASMQDTEEVINDLVKTSMTQGIYWNA